MRADCVVTTRWRRLALSSFPPWPSSSRLVWVPPCGWRPSTGFRREPVDGRHPQGGTHTSRDEEGHGGNDESASRLQRVVTTQSARIHGRMPASGRALLYPFVLLHFSVTNVNHAVGVQRDIVLV